ncbi:hypothetical protein JNK13_04425 [bacterium]|nr:hypothetical protein [bacterium]
MAIKLLNCLNRYKSDRSEKGQKMRLDALKLKPRFTKLSNKQVAVLHDILLFECAHQDSRRLSRYAELRLNDLNRFISQRRKKNPNYLLDSGIAATNRVDCFSFDLLKILSTDPRHAASIDWDTVLSEESAIDDFLQEIIFTIERDAVLDEVFSIQKQLEILLSRSKLNQLGWLLLQFETLPTTDRLRDYIFNSLELWVRWKANRNKWSRTFLRFPRIRTKQTGLIKISHSNAKKLIDVCRGALASRGRETDTVTYTDANYVTFYRWSNDPKIEIALFELTPTRRLPIETYVGFVVARNHVPIGYGGAWMFGFRAEIGINIFDEFRGGNSYHVFQALLDIYQQHYSVKTFLVQPSQFGDDNEEALKSGAFWFYYRLGFRPDHTKLANLALREARKKQQDANYRSSIKTLKMLSQKQLLLALGTQDQTADKHLSTVKISSKLIAQHGKNFAGDQHKAYQFASRWWKKFGGKSTCPEIARLVCLLPDINQWSRDDQLKLVEIFNLKQRDLERQFVKAVQKHSRFRTALIKQLKQS